MRPIRVLIGMLGLDQHEVGALAVAGMLRDAGMEVVYTGRFNLPQSIVKAAVEEGVDVIGLSCHSWEYLYYIDELLQLLRAQDLRIPVVVGGSVLIADDARTLLDKGVSAVLGPTATRQDIVTMVRNLASGR
jgi:methylmalonyl-CoA mutase C-terminal domain/subunit